MCGERFTLRAPVVRVFQYAGCRKVMFIGQDDQLDRLTTEPGLDGQIPAGDPWYKSQEAHGERRILPKAPISPRTVDTLKVRAANARDRPLRPPAEKRRSRHPDSNRGPLHYE